MCDARITDAKSTLQDTLCSFRNLGADLLEAKGDDASLDVATETSCGWLELEGLVAAAAEPTSTMSATLPWRPSAMQLTRRICVPRM